MCSVVFVTIYIENIGKSVEAINSLFHPTKSSFDEILILIFSLEFPGMGLNGQCIVATLVETLFKVNIRAAMIFLRSSELQGVRICH